MGFEFLRGLDEGGGVVGDVFPETTDCIGMVRVVGEVGPFFGISAVVVEFFAAVDIESVAVFLGAN